MSVMLQPSPSRPLLADGVRPFVWHWPNVFSVCALLFLGLNYFSAFADLDFSWQVRSGERILQTGQLLPPEGFTYTIHGQPISQFEWLYEVILALIWNGFGYGGLKLLRVVLVGMPLVLLALRLRREHVRWHGIALALITAIVVVAPAWNLRPMYCTTIGLLLVTGWLHDHCTGRRRLGWGLPVVMLLWSNLHPGVITGQGLLIGAIAWEWLNRWLKINTPLDRAACLRLTWVGGLGIAATFVSPAPIDRLLFPFQSQLAHPIQRTFSEMRPLYTVAFEPPFFPAVAYAVAGLVALSVAYRFRSYRLWEIALLVGLTGLANVAVRCLQDWLLIMLALGVPHLAVMRRQSVLQHRRLNPAHRPHSAWGSVVLLAQRLERSAKHVLSTHWFRPQWLWPVGAMILLAIFSAIPTISRRMPRQDAAAWPAAALHWIEKEGIAGRFFAPPDYGSYVGWRLRERGQVYVDTRGFLFPPKLLEDSEYLPQMTADWRSRLDRVLGYGTDYFLLETTGPRGELWRCLQPHIDKPLYFDDQAVLLSSAQVLAGLKRKDSLIVAGGARP